MTSLPSWIERLLGIESGPGEGTAWTLEHTWTWAPWVTLVFVAGAVALVLAIYARENREASKPYRALLALVRIALVLIALFMAAQYALSLQRTGLPYAVVLLDDSLSMTIADRYDTKLDARLRDRVRRASLDGLARWNLARTLLIEGDGALIDRIRQDYKLRVYFTTGPRPSRAEGREDLIAELRATEPTGESTRLGIAVRTILDELRGTAPAAVVIVTDGINTDGPGLADAADYARRKGVPLFTVGLGQDKPVRDLELADLLVDDAVFVDDLIHFEFTLRGTGYAGRKARITLRDRDRPGVLAELEATVGPDAEPQRLRLMHRASQPGETRYVVEVESLEGEQNRENNRQERVVRASDQKIRVLLAAGYPSYEFRYLANLLKRDSAVELKTVLQDADPEHAEQEASALRGFPVRLDELSRYDVIVLADANPEWLGDSILQNLADFVDNPSLEKGHARGGALVCISGPESMPWAYRDTPLARVFPIELAGARPAEAGRAGTGGFAMEPTELGLASPMMQLGNSPAESAAIWEKLPPLYWFVAIPEVKPGARVLARHSEATASGGERLPLVVMQYVGSGKVLFHATDETWRWRWRVGDVFFARYWVQTIRFLSRSKLSRDDASVVLAADRREYHYGEPVQLRIEFANPNLAPAADDGVTVVLEREGHKTQRVQLRRDSLHRGVFEGRLSEPAIGRYHAWVAVPTLPGRAPAVDFEVTAPPGEFRRVETDAAELRRAAERTKGRFYTFETAGRLTGDLPPGRQVPIESLPPKPLWNRWPVLLTFLLLLAVEWILRKAGGMV